MNTPALPEGSWAWRAPEDAFRPDLAARLRRMADLSGRLTPRPKGATEAER